MSDLTEVETVGWDISLGVANTKVGKLILKATSGDKTQVPESLEHVAIKIFGAIYEYGDWGVLKTEIAPNGKLKSRYPVGKLKNTESVGTTSKTKEEFEAWVEVQNNGDFKGSLYNVASHSCLVWAIRACEFLEVSYPPNWDKIRTYAQKNKRIANVMGASVMSSRKSSDK